MGAALQGGEGAGGGSPVGAPVSTFSHTVPYGVAQGCNMKGPMPVYAAPQMAIPLQPSVLHVAPQQASQTKSWRCWVLYAILFAAIYAGLGVLVWRRYRGYSTQGSSHQWMVDLVLQAGDAGAAERATSGSPKRAVVESIFAGTHVRGYPPGHPLHGEHWLFRLSDSRIFSKVEGQFGPVILGEKAELLRTTLQELGFLHRTLYHGTQNPFVTSILTGGFLFSDGVYGDGIYVAENMHMRSAMHLGQVKQCWSWRPIGDLTMKAGM
eukprot:CAMPEP_0115170736 /NCGR_PEP_ID=MMETSP0270-20121206/1945_1 /TAXON_ID=71861 /ORGANISM="Scrippsiella trochoidea, Strain CCMP3099" /LENGTH=265 /DNA_ID=CAMNT_0002583489 /DNA_START=20 /DNA_END=818 /DNA_ORIENTATION=-